MRRNKMVPHDIEAEKAVLGALLEDNELLSELDFLSVRAFYELKHQEIFEAMLNIGTSFDELLIGDFLKAKKQTLVQYAYLAELEECAPSTGNIVFYAMIIQEHYMSRKIIKLGEEVKIIAEDPATNNQKLLVDFQRKIDEIAGLSNQETEMHEIKDLSLNLFKELEKGKKDTGIRTGLIKVDDILVKIEKQDFVIIAARPGMGKTSLATRIAINTAKYNHNKTVLIFSLEMGKEQITEKIYSQESRVNLEKLRSVDLQGEDWDKLAITADFLIKKNNIIVVEKSGLSVNQIKHISQKVIKKVPVSLIIIDYLQLISASAIARKHGLVAETTEISNNLQQLFKDTNLPGIVLSQLSRKAEEGNKRPTLSGLRFSGALEQDADTVIFIYRDEYYNEESADKGIAEINIAKQRRGPTGMAKVAWNAKTTDFYNLSLQRF